MLRIGAAQPSLFLSWSAHSLLFLFFPTSGDINLNMVGVPCVVMSALGGIMAIVLFYINDSAPVTPKKDTPDSEKMGETMWQIHEAVAEGARTFLQTEYKYLAIAATLLAILLFAAVNWKTGICYLCGAIVSASCGYLGTRITDRMVLHRVCSHCTRDELRLSDLSI
jgi:Na+/H+-translocating membrane pyrophosphatase